MVKNEEGGRESSLLALGLNALRDGLALPPLGIRLSVWTWHLGYSDPTRSGVQCRRRVTEQTLSGV